MAGDGGRPGHGGAAPAPGPSRRGRTRAAGRGPVVPGRGPLAAVPPVVAFAVVAAVFAAGVLVGGPLGALLLVLLALGVAGLLAASWPRLRPAERAGRLLVLAVLVALAVALATGAAP